MVTANSLAAFAAIVAPKCSGIALADFTTAIVHLTTTSASSARLDGSVTVASAESHRRAAVTAILSVEVGTTSHCSDCNGNFNLRQHKVLQEIRCYDHSTSNVKSYQWSESLRIVCPHIHSSVAVVPHRREEPHRIRTDRKTGDRRPAGDSASYCDLKLEISDHTRSICRTRKRIESTALRP